MNQKSHAKSDYICPMDLPVAFVDVKLTTSKPQIGLEAILLWTTLHVSANVSSAAFPGTMNLAPLDAIILLDRV